MNILAINSNLPIMQNIMSVLSVISEDRFNFLIWDQSKMSAFDAFDFSRPDVVLLMENHINNQLMMPMEEYPNAKYVVLDADEMFTPFLSLKLKPACNPVQYRGTVKDKYKGGIAAITCGPSMERFYKTLEFNKARIYGEPLSSVSFVGGINTIKQKADIIKSCNMFVAFNEYDMLNAYYLGTKCTTFGLNPIEYKDQSTFNTVETLQEEINKGGTHSVALTNRTSLDQVSELFDFLSITEYKEEICNLHKKLGL